MKLITQGKKKGEVVPLSAMKAWNGGGIAPPIHNISIKCG